MRAATWSVSECGTMRVRQRLAFMSMGRCRAAIRLSAVALAAAGLSACVSTFGTQGPVVVETRMQATYLADCVAGLFNTRDPLVHRRSARGVTEIVALDLRNAPMAIVSIRPTREGSIAEFVSTHAQRYWYERLFRLCLPAR